MEKKFEINASTLPEALGAYAAADCARFHVPGHKGRGIACLLGNGIGKWDVTELSFSDNLHQPESILAEGERRLAAAYGAEASFFVVNGSSAAVQAMLLALDDTDKLLLARDCHKSAVAGAALRGIETAYLLPEYSDAMGLYGMVTPAALNRALADTKATAVLVTSPNYYGFTADLTALGETAHRHGALLLVDSAHGAHFPFSEALPRGCAGAADLWCHSQHKTLNALGQAASLHVGKCRIPPARVRRMLSLIQTTSPSYLLMASIDYATFSAPRQGWTEHVSFCRKIAAEIALLPGLAVFPDTIGAGVSGRDQTRLVIDVSARGITGYEAMRFLEGERIYIEMADLRRLVLITSPEDDPAWYDRLLLALQHLPYGKKLPAAQQKSLHFPKKRMSIREATMARAARVPLIDSAGRVLAEAAGVYPPGIAACMPGEEMDAETVEFLLTASAAGAALFGVSGGCVSVTEA